MKKTLSFEKDLTFQTMIGEVTTISFEEDLKFVNKSEIEGNFYISGKYKMTEASAIIEDFSYSIPIEITTIENYDLETTKIDVANFTYEIIDDNVLRCKIDILVEGLEEVLVEETEKVENKKEIIEEKEEIQIDNRENKDNIIGETAVLEENEEEIKESEVICNNEDSSVNDDNNDNDNNELRDCDGDLEENIDMELPIKESIDNSNIEKVDVKDELENTNINNYLEKNEKSDIMEENTTKRENATIKVNSLFANLGDENDTFATYSVYIMRDGDTLEKVMDKYKIEKEELEIYNDLSTIELNSKVIIPSSKNE